MIVGLFLGLVLACACSHHKEEVARQDRTTPTHPSANNGRTPPISHGELCPVSFRLANLRSKGNTSDAKSQTRIAGNLTGRDSIHLALDAG